MTRAQGEGGVATGGPWEVESFLNEDGCYGDGGPDARVGYYAYRVVDSQGRTLFDSLNSDAGCVHDEVDEDGKHAWDEEVRKNLTLAAAAPDLLAVAECHEAWLGRVFSETSTDECAAVFARHGFDPGESEITFLTRLRRAALAKARGESVEVKS